MQGTRDSFYVFIWTLVHILFRVFFHLEIQGYRRVPMKGAVILAANHISLLDPPIVAISTTRQLNFFAKRELFQIPFLGRLITRLQAMPVDRSGADRKALKLVLDLLQREEAILLFPEGTRSRDGHLHKPKSGVGMIALNSRKPIVPVYVEGTAQARKTLLRQQRAAVKFGKPFHIEKLPLTGDRRTDYKIISEEVMERIRKLRDGEDED